MATGKDGRVAHGNHSIAGALAGAASWTPAVGGVPSRPAPEGGGADGVGETGSTGAGVIGSTATGGLAPSTGGSAPAAGGVATGGGVGVPPRAALSPPGRRC